MRIYRSTKSSFNLYRVAFISLLYLCCAFHTKALNYYWVGDGGNWSNLSHWATTSGGNTFHSQVPTAVDDVFFDANSFSGPSQVVYFDLDTAYAHHVNWTGVLFSPSCNGFYNRIMKIYGSLTLVPNMQIWKHTYFSATTAGQTITSAGHLFLNTTIFNGDGGEWTFQDAFSAQTISFEQGTIHTNDQTVTASSFYSTSALPRRLNMSASVFNLTGTSAMFLQNSTNLTINSGTSVLNCTADGAILTSNSSGNYTFNDVNFTSTVKGSIAGSAHFHDVYFHGDGEISSISSSNSFHDLNFTAGHNYTLAPLSEITILGSLNATGTCIAMINISPSLTGFLVGIKSAVPINVSYVRMSRIVASGGGTFTATHSMDLCCNTGWTFIPPPVKNLYWVGNTGNWNDGNHWSLTSGGAPAGCHPFETDNVIFDANSFTIPGQSVTMNAIGYCRNMNWTGVTHVPTFAIQGTNQFYVSGSFTLDPAMHIQYTSIIILNAKTPGHTVTTAGHLLSRFWFNGTGGEWTLQDTFNSDYAVTLSGGTLNTNDQTINAVQFWVLGFYTPKTLNIGSSVFNLSGREPISLSNDGLTVNSGASVINLTNDTATFFNSTILSNNIFTFYDVNFTGHGIGIITGPLNFHNVTFNGKGEIGAKLCTFNEANFLSDGYIYGSHLFHDLNFTAGHTYRFKAGTTQTISNRWRTQGTCTDSIKLKSDLPGSFANIKKLTDTVKASYNDIRDMHCTGGAAFMAYQSADQGGNAGWNFANLPPLSAPGPVNGPTTVCVNAIGIVYHTSPQPGVISYQWTVPAGASIVSGQGDTLIVVDFGSATSGNIEVFSSNSCQFSNTGSHLFVTVSTAPVPTASLATNTNGPVCQGLPVIFTATVTGAGPNSVRYQFYVNGNSIQDSNINSYTSSGLSNGDVVTCVVTVSSGSCFNSVRVTTNPVIMQIEPLLTPSVTLTSGQGNLVCPATVVLFHATANDIGNGTVNYLFAVNGIAVQNSQADTYAATVHNNDVISCVITVTGGSCYTSTSATSNVITMQVDSSAQLVQVHAGADVKIFGAQPVQLNGSGDAGTYLWTPPTGLSASNILNPVASPAVTTIYTLTITNANGCSASDFTKVEVEETGCPIMVVNAITPNGDGINDKLIISTGSCNGYTSVTVFNRYGTMVFQSKQYQNDWQGTYKGKPLPDGTYYAVITYQSIQGKIISKRTDLTILR